MALFEENRRELTCNERMVKRTQSSQGHCKGGISAYKSGEIVDALIAKSVDEYDAVLTEKEKELYEQYQNEKDEEKKQIFG